MWMVILYFSFKVMSYLNLKKKTPLEQSVFVLQCLTLIATLVACYTLLFTTRAVRRVVKHKFLACALQIHHKLQRAECNTRCTHTRERHRWRCSFLGNPSGRVKAVKINHKIRIYGQHSSIFNWIQCTFRPPAKALNAQKGDCKI
jgi:hypothetical protein